MRLFKNAGILFSGNIVASAFGIVSLSLTARALGTESFGVLVMITTYVLIIDRLVNFQTWQAIIKYGADALAKKNYDDFKALIRFGFLLDGGTAVLGTILAASFAWFFGRMRGWNDTNVLMAMLYSFTILFNINGTPTAILRLHDKFKALSIQRAIGAAIKLIGCTIAFVTGAGLWSFLLVWAVTDIAGKLILILLSLIELKKQNLSGMHRLTSSTCIADRFKGIWSFVWTTNLNASIRMASREIDIMLVGGVLGLRAVGLYKIAKQFSSIITLAIDPMYQAIYPELSKLYAKRNIRQFVAFGIKSAFLAGTFAIGVWGAFLVCGDIIIQLTVGADFIKAKGIMLWYMVAICIAAIAFPLQPAMLSIGRPKSTFYVHIGSSVLYLSILTPLLKTFDLNGAGISYILYYVAWSTTMTLLLAMHLRSDSRA